MTKTTVAWMWGAGVGAITTLLLDPARGRRRRAILRDKLACTRHTMARAISVTRRDLGHRLAGTVAEVRGYNGRRHPDDDVLLARVRSALGRHVSHPHAIEVTCSDGTVKLGGPVLAHEVEGLITAVRHVPGVRDLDSHIEVHKTAGTVPGLQGGAGRRRPRWLFMRDNWSPTARLVAGSGGAGLLAWSLRAPAPVALASLAAGTGLIARSLTNHHLRRLLGLSGRRAIDVQKTIEIAAPMSEVFALWQHYENFPRFMRHVRDVRNMGNGRSRWTVDGPGGVPVRWDAEVTRFVPNELIAWKSVPGSTIAHAGIVRFDETAVGTTRVTIRLSYNPVAGVAGHGVAMLFGTDPKHQLDQDLVRMKTLIEHGIVAHDAARRDEPFINEGMPQSQAGQPQTRVHWRIRKAGR